MQLNQMICMDFVFNVRETMQVISTLNQSHTIMNRPLLSSDWNQMKFSTVYVLKGTSLLPSNPFSRGPLKQQRSLAQSSQTLPVSEWTLFGNW